jgi:hypothetical protein
LAPPVRLSLSDSETVLAIHAPRTPVIQCRRRGTELFAPTDWRFAGVDGTFGGRFDDPGQESGIAQSQRFRTVYCASLAEGAFIELLGNRQPPTEAYRLAAGLSLEDLEGTVDPNYPNHGLVDAGWWRNRLWGETILDSDLLFFELSSSMNLAYLQRALSNDPHLITVPRITVALTTGQLRGVTQTISRHIHELIDPRGVPCFAGIHYGSQWGMDLDCWALFDDRFIHSAVTSHDVLPTTSGLVKAASILQLTIQIADESYERPWST